MKDGKPVPINSVKPLDNVAGIYEAVLDKNQILYTTPDGKYILQGSLVATDTMTNLTKQRTEELSKINFSELPKNPIVLKKGKGERRIAVFADPNCVYCKKFEHELENVDNLTVLLFPIPILAPSSQTISASVACSKNPVADWKGWMLEGKAVATNECEKGKAIIKTNLDFARSMGITGTPTIYFENGERSVGLLPKDALEEKLKNISDSKKNTKSKK